MRAREGKEAIRESGAGRDSAELRAVESQIVKRVGTGAGAGSAGLPEHLWFNKFILSSSSPTGERLVPWRVFGCVCAGTRWSCAPVGCARPFARPFARRARARGGFRKLPPHPPFAPPFALF